MCFRPHDPRMPSNRTRGAKVRELWREAFCKYPNLKICS
nr:unnamed protein product [Callosobruchus chinensis]